MTAKHVQATAYQLAGRLSDALTGFASKSAALAAPTVASEPRCRFGTTTRWTAQNGRVW